MTGLAAPKKGDEDRAQRQRHHPDRDRRQPYAMPAEPPRHSSPLEKIAEEPDRRRQCERHDLACNARRAVSQPAAQRKRERHQRGKGDRDGQGTDSLGERQQRDKQGGRLEPYLAVAEGGGMHANHRGGNQDGEQQNRDPGGLAVEQEIGERDQQHGDAQAAAIAWRGAEEGGHGLIFLMASHRHGGGLLRTNGGIAAGLARCGSTSHQPSLRSR
ncbi:hypothetical protein [Mesorhizobium australicum]|uniref:hypothetical protein n=1 Tax=Mesorhizobium australicum TaxID=536018 RepID=UPI00333CDA93